MGYLCTTYSLPPAAPLETKCYSIAKAAIWGCIEQGLPALDASGAKPRPYSHMADGYPAMWQAVAEPLHIGIVGAAPGISRASGIAQVLAGRSGGASSANTSGSKVAVIPI